LPASQLDAPPTTRLPVPPRTPPLSASEAIVEAPFSVSVPALMLVAAPALKLLATVRLPPVTASASSPRIVRLLTVLVPDRWVTVCAPGALMKTSSAAPGRSGLEPQLVTRSQKLDPPIQLTTAAWAGLAPATAPAKTAISNAEPGRWKVLRMATPPDAARERWPLALRPRR
jgi:hypothetical protein